MTGLIKMYFYRMSRSAGLAISLAVCLLCVFIPFLEQRIPVISMLFAPVSTVSGATLNIFASGLPCAVSAVYLSAVFADDFSNGFIKNIIPAVKSRNTIFLARTAVTVIFAAGVYIMVSACSFIFYGAVMGYNTGFDASYLKTLFLVFLMSVAFLMFTGAMTILTRGMVMSVLFAVSFATGFSIVPVAVGESLIFGVADPSYEAHFYTYVLSYIIKNTEYEFSVLKAVAMSAVYIIVSVAISLAVLNMRDEK